MGAMNALPRSVPLTYYDLQGMPDDGHRYELIDGTLIVTPAPRTLHQEVVLNLALALKQAVPADLAVLIAPVDYVVSTHTVLQPDLLVARRSEIGVANVQGTPLLVIEVLSPSTRRIDEGSKRLAFEAAGVPQYWLVDPDEPSIVVLDLVDGAYVETARVSGAQPLEVTVPFELTVVPASLVE